MKTDTIIPESPSELSMGTKERLDHKIRLLGSLLDNDVKEQQETFAFLQQAIDEDRASHRKRFGAS